MADIPRKAVKITLLNNGKYIVAFMQVAESLLEKTFNDITKAFQEIKEFLK